MKSSIKEFLDNPPIPKFETDDDYESEEDDDEEGHKEIVDDDELRAVLQSETRDSIHTTQWYHLSIRV